MKANVKPNKIFALLKETFQQWNNSDPFRHSAVIAYYAIFSLPALLIIVIQVAGLVYEESAADTVQQQLAGILGSQAAEQIQSMVASSSELGNNVIGIIIGIGTLLFGATGVFYQLQQSLNQIWEVELKPTAGIAKIAIDRATSLGIILAIGFLLLIFMVITTLLGYLGSWIQRQLPDALYYVFNVINILLPLAIITVLFALIYKVLPDVKIEWKSVWVGAFVTSLLFAIGKIGLGLYFSMAEPTSTFGVAGSVILVMLWVNYAALILLFGAEFTWVYAKSRGHQVVPNSYARYNSQVRLKELEEQRNGINSNTSKVKAEH